MDFSVPWDDGDFARLQKHVCSTCCGNSASERARMAIIHVLKCFKKLELPSHVLPLLGEQQDGSLRSFILTTINNRIIKKTQDTCFSKCDEAASSSSTGYHPSLYVWESHDVLPPSSVSADATANSSGPPLAMLTPPAFTSSPLSPDSMMTDLLPAPTLWAGSLCSRCFNRSPCLAVTPTQVPVISEVVTI